MNNARKAMPSALPKGMHDMGIEWEDMPSLTHLLETHGAAPSAALAWADTLPASLEMLTPPTLFLQPLPGLEIHEVTEPEIFKIFFDSGQPDGAEKRA